MGYLLLVINKATYLIYYDQEDVFKLLLTRGHFFFINYQQEDVFYLY